MGLLDRIRRTSRAEPAPPATRSDAAPGDVAPADAADQPSADRSLELPSPGSVRPGDEERARIAAGLAALETDGVDVDDLDSLGRGLDRALTAWTARPEGGHREIVERYAVGVGEHLVRRTDLSWAVVTDVFGTDLGVSAGDFVVVPHNLVAVRWMRRETGWVPGVVGHLVELRTR